MGRFSWAGTWGACSWTEAVATPSRGKCLAPSLPALPGLTGPQVTELREKSFSWLWLI